MTKYRRVYEAAILKTLGASGRLIATMLLLEYGVLGAIAGTVGALGAIALSWGVARYALDLPWHATPLITLTGIAATSVLVATIGVLASIDVLRHSRSPRSAQSNEPDEAPLSVVLRSPVVRRE
jgi:putative ABC transport system permease protein